MAKASWVGMIALCLISGGSLLGLGGKGCPAVGVGGVLGLELDISHKELKTVREPI